MITRLFNAEQDSQAASGSGSASNLQPLKAHAQLATPQQRAAQVLGIVTNQLAQLEKEQAAQVVKSACLVLGITL